MIMVTKKSVFSLLYLITTILILSLSILSCDDSTPTKADTSVTDIDGNTYQTITIGSQIWMKENLRVSKYKNGDQIQNVSDITNWGILTTGAFIYYNNESANDKSLGKLYNWMAANDSRGICPSGWHLPSDSEWTILTNTLGGEAVAGKKMKLGWGSGSNESGFSALSSGVLQYDLGSVPPTYFINEFSMFWSSTVYTTDFYWCRTLVNAEDWVGKGAAFKRVGQSVRCLKD